ncbi:MAG: LemA family protein [Candidatus Sulfotelmatobacter sp.]
MKSFFASLIAISTVSARREFRSFAPALPLCYRPIDSEIKLELPKEPLMFGIVILVILVVIAVVLVGMYNSLVQLRVRCDSAWSDIDVQLKRRHDLIPNLVETVKGYAAHEKGTFENIAKFRSQAMQATTPEGKAVAENQLTGALKSLFAVAENYPELKASEQFTKLQGSLSQTEDSIQNARSYYNQVVRDLNTTIQSFPNSILANMFGFTARQFFETAEADREPVAVKF